MKAKAAEDLDIRIGIVGDERRNTALGLCSQVEADFASIDVDGIMGCTKNHVRSWQLLANDRKLPDWAVVMEDDAVPVEGFRQQLAAALAVAPAPIVSLYLGRGYIDDLRVGATVDRADLLGANWITTPGRILHAVALAVRKDVLPDLVRALPTGAQPIDRALSMWARRQGHQVAYSCPSLVEHQDGESLVTRYRRAERRAWRVGARDEWCDKMMSMP